MWLEYKNANGIWQRLITTNEKEFVAPPYFDLLKSDGNVEWPAGLRSSFVTNDRKMKMQSFKLHWSNKIGDGIARVGKVLVKYLYDSTHPVAQAFEGLSRTQQVLKFATDFPWHNRMFNLADRGRKEFIDEKKEKLQEIVEKINAVYQGSFAKIENIKVEIYNDQQIENTALSALAISISVKDGSGAGSGEIKETFDDMLSKNWGFEDNKIFPETVSITETFKSDFGIDIFSGTGFISTGAPSGAGL